MTRVRSHVQRGKVFHRRPRIHVQGLVVAGASRFQGVDAGLAVVDAVAVVVEEGADDWRVSAFAGQMEGGESSVGPGIDRGSCKIVSKDLLAQQNQLSWNNNGVISCHSIRPLSSNNSTALEWPHRAAKCSAQTPPLEGKLTSAP